MCRLPCVTEQALPQRQRINRERQSIHQRVPAARFVGFDSGEVALDDALIAQGTEFLQLRPADSRAGFGKKVQRSFILKLLVQLNQFADFVAARMIERALDRGQFVRDEDLAMILLKKLPERIEVRDRRDAQRFRDGRQRQQSLRRTELLRERVPVAEPLMRFGLQQLFFCQQHFVKRVSRFVVLRCAHIAAIASEKFSKTKINFLKPNESWASIIMNLLTLPLFSFSLCLAIEMLILCRLNPAAITRTMFARDRRFMLNTIYDYEFINSD